MDTLLLKHIVAGVSVVPGVARVAFLGSFEKKKRIPFAFRSTFRIFAFPNRYNDR